MQTVPQEGLSDSKQEATDLAVALFEELEAFCALREGLPRYIRRFQPRLKVH